LAVDERVAAVAFGFVGLIHLTAAVPAIQLFATGRSRHAGAGAALAGSVPRVREVLVGAAPYGVMGVLYMLYSQVPIVMANEVLGAEAAALYNMTFILVASSARSSS
jgi:O-antigen/teichoic acid export membrane protein